MNVWKWEFTQFDFSVQREKNVSSFQISVDDLVLVKVDQGLQGLTAHDSNLRLRQWPLQFWGVNTEFSLERKIQPNIPRCSHSDSARSSWQIVWFFNCGIGPRMTFIFYAQLDFNGLDHKLGQFHLHLYQPASNILGKILGKNLTRGGVKTEGQIIIIIQLQIELTGILSHSRKGKKQCWNITSRIRSGPTTPRNLSCCNYTVGGGSPTGEKEKNSHTGFFWVE